MNVTNATLIGEVISIEVEYRREYKADGPRMIAAITTSDRYETRTEIAWVVPEAVEAGFAEQLRELADQIDAIRARAAA